MPHLQSVYNLTTAMLSTQLLQVAWTRSGSQDAGYNQSVSLNFRDLTEGLNTYSLAAWSLLAPPLLAL